MSSNRRQAVKAWILVLQIGIGILSPVILCVAAGIFLDNRYGWKVTIPFLILGILAGLNSAWHLVKGFIGEDSEETKLRSGIYDRKIKSDTGPDEEEEDYFLEEYKKNNRLREK